MMKIQTAHRRARRCPKPRGPSGLAVVQPLEPRLFLSGAVNMLDFYPLIAGSTYSYDATDTIAGVSTTSAAVRMVQDASGASQAYLSESIDGSSNATKLYDYSSGLQLLAQGWLVDTGTDFQVFDPGDPLLVFPRQVELGTEYTDTKSYGLYHSDDDYTGTLPDPAEIIDTMTQTGTGTFVSTLTPLGFEAVTVPAGTFTALKATLVNTWTDDGGADITDTYTLWLGQNVGEIKKDLTFGVDSEQVYELTDFSVTGLVARSSHLRAGSPVRFVDADGEAVTVSMVGPGSGDVQFASQGDADASAILLYDTTGRSGVTVSVRGAQASTSVGQFQVVGSLGRVTADSLDLTNALRIDGEAGILRFGDATGTITLGGSAGESEVAITLHDAADLDLQSTASIHQLSVNQWAGGAVSAPQLRKLTSRGDFNADVTLNAGAMHQLDSGVILGQVTIGGDLTDAVWSVTGSASSVTVSGNTDGWDLTVLANSGHSRLQSLSLGQVTSATVDVEDAVARVQTGSWLAGSLTADSIGTMRVTGGSGFLADLTVEGGHLAKASDLALGMLTVDAWLGAEGAGNSTVTVLGHVGKITAGAARNVDLFVGTAADPASVDDFVTGNFRVRSLTLRGVLDSGVRTYLSGSTLAAYGIDTLAFGRKGAAVETSTVKTKAGELKRIVLLPATPVGEWLAGLT